MKTNKRAVRFEKWVVYLNDPPLKWFEIRLEIKNGEGILIGGEEGNKVKERVRHKFGKIPGSRVGLGSSRSNCKVQGTSLWVERTSRACQFRHKSA